MRPIKFEQSNATYVAEGCGDLPTWRDADRIISCWKGGWIQRFKFLFTGKMWFHVFGTVHPPVLMHTDNPFKPTGKNGR